MLPDNPYAILGRMQNLVETREKRETPPESATNNTEKKSKIVSNRVNVLIHNVTLWSESDLKVLDSQDDLTDRKYT